MNKNEFIEKYIQNKLSAEEKRSFDKLVMQDAEFKEDVKWHENLKRVTEHKDDADFKTLISEIESKQVVKSKNFTKWIAAASIVLVVGVSYFFFSNDNTNSNKLFTDYFEPYRNVIQPIERGNSLQDEKTLAFIAYEKGDYKKAITLFSKLYKSTDESYYLFYQANALLKLEKAKEAVPLLLEHLKTKDTLTPKSRWYLALAYLKLNKKEKAKISLKKVISDGKYKTKEARELLKKIK